MTENWLLSYLRSWILVLTWLIMRSPWSTSMIRVKASVIEVFPAPVLPIIPIFSFRLMFRFISFSTKSRSSRYLKLACLNWMMKRLSSDSAQYGYLIGSWSFRWRS